jgi:hypothetical protein
VLLSKESSREVRADARLEAQLSAQWRRIRTKEQRLAAQKAREGAQQRRQARVSLSQQEGELLRAELARERQVREAQHAEEVALKRAAVRAPRLLVPVGAGPAAMAVANAFLADPAAYDTFLDDVLATEHGEQGDAGMPSAALPSPSRDNNSTRASTGSSHQRKPSPRTSGSKHKRFATAFEALLSTIKDVDPLHTVTSARSAALPAVRDDDDEAEQLFAHIEAQTAPLVNTRATGSDVDEETKGAAADGDNGNATSAAAAATAADAARIAAHAAIDAAALAPNPRFPGAERAVRDKEAQKARVRAQREEQAAAVAARKQRQQQGKRAASPQQPGSSPSYKQAMVESAEKLSSPGIVEQVAADGDQSRVGDAVLALVHSAAGDEPEPAAGAPAAGQLAVATTGNDDDDAAVEPTSRTSQHPRAARPSPRKSNQGHLRTSYIKADIQLQVQPAEQKQQQQQSVAACAVETHDIVVHPIPPAAAATVTHKSFLRKGALRQRVLTAAEVRANTAAAVASANAEEEVKQPSTDSDAMHPAEAAGLGESERSDAAVKSTEGEAEEFKQQQGINDEADAATGTDVASPSERASSSSDVAASLEAALAAATTPAQVLHLQRLLQRCRANVARSRGAVLDLAETGGGGVEGGVQRRHPHLYTSSFALPSRRVIDKWTQRSIQLSTPAPSAHLLLRSDDEAGKQQRRASVDSSDAANKIGQSAAEPSPRGRKAAAATAATAAYARSLRSSSVRTAAPTAATAPSSSALQLPKLPPGVLPLKQLKRHSIAKLAAAGVGSPSSVPSSPRPPTSARPVTGSGAVDLAPSQAALLARSQSIFSSQLPPSMVPHLPLGATAAAYLAHAMTDRGSRGSRVSNNSAAAAASSGSQSSRSSRRHRNSGLRRTADASTPSGSGSRSLPPHSRSRSRSRDGPRLASSLSKPASLAVDLARIASVDLPAYTRPSRPAGSVAGLTSDAPPPPAGFVPPSRLQQEIYAYIASPASGRGGGGTALKRAPRALPMVMSSAESLARDEAMLAQLLQRLERSEAPSLRFARAADAFDPLAALQGAPGHLAHSVASLAAAARHEPWGARQVYKPPALEQNATPALEPGYYTLAEQQQRAREAIARGELLEAAAAAAELAARKAEDDDAADASGHTRAQAQQEPQQATNTRRDASNASRESRDGSEQSVSSNVVVGATAAASSFASRSSETTTQPPQRRGQHRKTPSLSHTPSPPQPRSASSSRSPARGRSVAKAGAALPQSKAALVKNPAQAALKQSVSTSSTAVRSSFSRPSSSSSSIASRSSSSSRPSSSSASVSASASTVRRHGAAATSSTIKASPPPHQLQQRQQQQQAQVRAPLSSSATNSPQMKPRGGAGTTTGGAHRRAGSMQHVSSNPSAAVPSSTSSGSFNASPRSQPGSSSSAAAVAAGAIADLDLLSEPPPPPPHEQQLASSPPLSPPNAFVVVESSSSEDTPARPPAAGQGHARRLSSLKGSRPSSRGEGLSLSVSFVRGLERSN